MQLLLPPLINGFSPSPIPVKVGDVSSSRSSGRLWLSVDDDNSKREEQSSSERNIPESEGLLMSDAELQREVKKFKAKAEIDALLQDPDAPFDLEGELQKVKGGISPPLPSDSPESVLEDIVHELETAMYAAASAGDLDTAQSKKNEINQIHIDDCGNVLQANSLFYKAFSDKDYDVMERLWLHDASALCIHPSHSPIVGAKNVLSSWKNMFESESGGFQKNKMEPSNIRLSVKGTTAVVTCDEEVYTRRFVRGRSRLEGESGDAPQGMELVNKLVATNIFRKVGGSWFMIHHHATWHADSEAAKKALNSQTGGSKSETRTSRSRSDDAMNISAEGILGIPGHEGLNGRTSRSSEKGEGQGPIRRVFTGSLSDLLGGGLDDILNGGGSDDESDATIIDLSGMDDDEDEGLDRLDNEDKGVSIKGATKESNDGKKKRKKEKAENDSKDTIRQNCISSLRKLANQGIISRKQKTILLTDIITCSARGEYSLVEVAYDLLCGEGDDKDAAEEDFADQCQVFASNLPPGVPMQESR
jgi:ketosteroid isomerase-like protein